MDVDQVLPSLYVGSFPSIDDVDTLKQTGITSVLSLQSDDDLGVCGINWTALRARYRSSNIEVRRVPIVDFDDDNLRDKLPEAVRVLNELLSQNHTVFVHCNAGMNRSPSIVLCYLHWMGGMSLEDAEQHVRRSRSCAPVLEVIRMATCDRRRDL